MSVFRVLAKCVALAVLAAGSLGAAPAERPAEIPFELVQNEIVVSARLNGKGPFLMTLDTSTDPSTIDIGAALKMGLTVNPAGEEVEGGETEEGKVYDTRFTVVELGTVSARDVDALAGGMVAKRAKRLGRAIVGVLGRNFLAGRIVQFDYPKRMLRFLPDPPAGGSVAGRRAVLAFKDDEAVLIDELSIGGQRLKGAIETGSSEAITLTSEAARKLGLENAKAPVAVRNLAVGSITSASSPASVLAPAAAKGRKPWEASLGNAFLKDFVLTIDYPDSKVVLEKP